MNQTRIVLDKKLVPVANRILEETGINNYSQLVAILLKNYGDRLVNSLKQ